MKLLYCSFCGKNQHEVAKLIAGPQVFICCECVALCVEIIDGGSAADIEYESWLAVLRADASARTAQEA